MNNGKLALLTPVIDGEGILRANGRIRNLPKELFENCPVILDEIYYVTSLIIKFYHDKFNHGNYDTVINEMRQKCWIPGLRNALGSITSRCVTCRKFRARPVCPIMV